MADVATPATEVPKAKPSPFTGAASEARIACRSVAVSSAMPVPRSVDTMPRNVPSMPSSTSSPTRYGVSAGPGSATRSPSTRRRTAWRSPAGRRSSQPSRLAGASDRPCTACASPSVACR
ncbi:hypothetical protein D9M72_307250 [compost metagenome]